MGPLVGVATETFRVLAKYRSERHVWAFWERYDRYFASTRKVSVLIHPNRPILMENVQRPGDSGSEASCRRDLVPWQDHIGLGSHCLYRWSWRRIPRHRTGSRRHGASLAESHGIFICSTRMGLLGGVMTDTFQESRSIGHTRTAHD